MNHIIESSQHNSPVRHSHHDHANDDALSYPTTNYRDHIRRNPTVRSRGATLNHHVRFNQPNNGATVSHPFITLVSLTNITRGRRGKQSTIVRSLQSNNPSEELLGSSIIPSLYGASERGGRKFFSQAHNSRPVDESRNNDN